MNTAILSTDLSQRPSKTWPRGATTSADICLAQANDYDWDKSAHRLLPAGLRAQYHQAVAQAQTTCLRIIERAQATYYQANTKAWKQCEIAAQVAWEHYAAAAAKAWKAYEDRLRPARQAHLLSATATVSHTYKIDTGELEMAWQRFENAAANAWYVYEEILRPARREHSERLERSWHQYATERQRCLQACADEQEPARQDYARIAAAAFGRLAASAPRKDAP